VGQPISFCRPYQGLRETRAFRRKWEDRLEELKGKDGSGEGVPIDFTHVCSVGDKYLPCVKVVLRLIAQVTLVLTGFE